jgi:hypothetical protein
MRGIAGQLIKSKRTGGRQTDRQATDRGRGAERVGDQEERERDPIKGSVFKRKLEAVPWAAVRKPPPEVNQELLRQDIGGRLPEEDGKPPIAESHERLTAEEPPHGGT